MKLLLTRQENDPPAKRKPGNGAKLLVSFYLMLMLCQLVSAQPATQEHSISGNLLNGDSFSINVTQLQVAQSPQVETHSLLIFWASWCSTCMREIPQLKQLYSRHSSRVQFLGINVNTTVADGLEIERQRELPYPSLSDPDLQIADRFGVRGTPTLILLDADGREIARTTRLEKVFLGILEDVTS